ncbi:hypothetical protein CDES_04695 [Corynebacterium deserti GIMN1.010]|uniref:Uncharacterized protein n=2 Tax=Corynebacterium TaxID=1716 RepID=A0A0M3Q9B9_9CORY|nr:hypothetical protein CDES_04695 [Corynebacterium deserti GIMN1.010]
MAVVARGRAAMIIAHRLNEAGAADRIVVMSAGEIIESGTHHELGATGGTYEQLWRAWS